MIHSNYRTWLVSGAVGLGLAACVQEVPERYVPTVTPKLVVTGFIGAGDSLLEVEVARTLPIYTVKQNWNEVEIVEGAEVRISDGQEAWTLELVDSAGVYRRIIPTDFIKPERTYYLHVTTPTGEQAEALCTVPSPGGDYQMTYTIDTAVRKYPYQEIDDTLQYLSLFWDDVPGTGDFYHAYAHLRYEAIYYDWVDGQIVDSVWTEQESHIFFSDGISGTSDEGRDGERLVARGGYLQRLNDGGNAWEQRRNLRLTAYLLRVDENYYRYHSALQQQWESDGNPFAEPAPLFSNLEGALGAFGAFHATTLEIEL
ncbi:protein of unknown function [Catalinimonas alkaloidigena]|uniref:DUF4249 domain-containing protein n=1 Tax=Catalinimonas alkaloidigena TaxID=1075417 RepID=A0A1G8WE43_9BACT|nr:DUF4249 domain-containing protein [Catalinimonas alkaloidigena]SDJ76538.1 protein of unknown function [Catalinimonas alkaloidigena]